MSCISCYRQFFMELAGQDLRQNPDFAAIINVEGQLPPDVLDQLDGLREQAVAAMEAGQKPEILSPMDWDAVLILRRTGMRFEDLAHLKMPDAHGRGGCLVQDSEGYWWIAIDHRFTKTGHDHRIPTR